MTLRDALRLYLVTDRDLAGPRGVVETCRLALRGGVKVVQLRDKQASAEALTETAVALRVLTAEQGALFLVNDRVEVARAVGADGVHLGQGDLPVAEARRLLGPEAIIGVSVRTEAEARRACADGADYLAANGVYATATKTDLDAPLGLEGVGRLAAVAGDLPLVAIGGLHGGNAAAVLAAGADGVAVVSAIMAAPDPEAATGALLAALAAGG